MRNDTENPRESPVRYVCTYVCARAGVRSARPPIVARRGRRGIGNGKSIDFAVRAYVRTSTYVCVRICIRVERPRDASDRRRDTRRLREYKKPSLVKERFAYLAFARRFTERLDKLTEILPAVRFSVNVACTRRA